MNSHNEKEEILILGKKKIDVSNIPYGRIEIASNVWNKTISKEGVTSKETRVMINSVGRYLIRQPFIVLLRRFSFWQSIQEYLKRLFITNKTLKLATKSQFEEFDSWVSYTMTGKKKEDLQRQEGILELLNTMVKELEAKTNLSQEKCLELLRTSAGVIVESLTTSTQDQAV